MLFECCVSKDPDGILELIARAGRDERIVAFAEERSMPGFQAGTLGDALSLDLAGERLRVRGSVLICLVEEN